MELKPDYKLTEVGVIPNEWDVASIGSLIFDYRGGASLKPSDFTNTGVKVLPKGGVGRTGWLNVTEDEQKYCSPEYAAANYRNQVDETYTIVVLRDLVPSGPSIGLIVQIRDKETYVLAQGVYGFKVNEKAIPGYLVHLSNTNWYRKMANSIMVGSTQVHITNTAYKKVLIPLPPLPEQEAIAEALSDADALIEALEDLIAKKRQVKQGAMQELLTGKRRLSGFSDEWKPVSLIDVLTQSATYGIVKAGEFQLTGVPMVRGGDIKDSKILTDLPYVTEEKSNEFSRTILKADDVVIALVGYPGEAAKVPSELVGANISRAVGLLRLNSKINPDYLVCYLNSPQGRSMVLAPSAGSAQLVVNLSELNKLQFNLPPLPEQTAIAEILSDMDAEITALEGKLSKAREVKAGMMSVLLSGRVRLV